MTGGKPVQGGVRVRLARGINWDQLSKMSRQEIQERDVFPEGFKPLPHPHHEEGGMVFPQSHIDEILEQEGRNLNRFDLEFDLPEHLLAEFFRLPSSRRRARNWVTSRRGSWSRRRTSSSCSTASLNPKQLDGLRLTRQPVSATAVQPDERSAERAAEPRGLVFRLRGEEIFFGKGRCAECHAPLIFSDNFMHDLQTERFYDEGEIVNGRKMSDGGPT